MRTRENETANRLVAACERAICRSKRFSDVTVRAIAAEAGVAASAVSHHFGSLEDLVAETGMRAYRRLNAERLEALQAAVDAHRPAPPPLRDVIAALVGPSVRWSLDPDSPYRVFTYLQGLSTLSDRPERFNPMTEHLGHHRAFIQCLRRIAPWFDEIETGWRLNAALGVRSQFTRHRSRSALLTRNQMDLTDPAAVIERMIEVIQPMFARPEPAAGTRTAFGTRHPAVRESG
jgi:AcrR family transcriptional regulator